MPRTAIRRVVSLLQQGPKGNVSPADQEAFWRNAAGGGTVTGLSRNIYVCRMDESYMGCIFGRDRSWLDSRMSAPMNSFCLKLAFCAAAVLAALPAASAPNNSLPVIDLK